MSMTTTEVAAAFAAGTAEASGLRAAGRVAYSYAEPIAVRMLDAKVAAVTTDKWSRTTSKHVNLVCRALQDAGYKVVQLSFVEFAKGRKGTKADALLRATVAQVTEFAAQHASAKRRSANRYSDGERALADATPAGKRRAKLLKETAEDIGEAAQATYAALREMDGR